jgi:hypothetical protein
MDTLEKFLSDFIVKMVHKAVPTATAADDAQVAKAVADLATAVMDLVTVYFALRNAGK